MKAEIVPAPPRDPDIIEGQVVDPPRAAPLRVIGTVARHERTRAAGRHVMYVPLGAAVVTKRLWESRTTARYERWMRAAGGDLDKVMAIEERLAAFRRDRHQRRVDMFEIPFDLVMRLPGLAWRVFLVLAAIGAAMALYTHHLAAAAEPVVFTALVVAVVIAVITAMWVWLLGAASLIAVGALYWTGRAAAAAGTGPQWAATSATPDTDVSIDETTITRALDALRIPQITAYLREGVPMQYLTPCRRDGRGTHAVIRLPSGVPAERIARRRADFASGVYRLAKEVWLTTGEEEGILDSWIADKGALNEGAGPYPLLDDGPADG